MSLRVIFVIFSLLAVGLYAGWEMIHAFLQGRFLIQPAVLFVPVSIGLALGFSSARSVADGLFKAIYVFSFVTSLFLFASSRSALPEAIRGLDGFWVATVLLLFYLAFLGFLHWLLFTQPFDEWFTRGTREPVGRRDPETPVRTRG